MRKVHHRHEAGFTLIEGVVAISIVALLAAILTPLVVQQIDEAKVSRARNEVQVVAASIGKFYKDVGQFPNQGAGGTVTRLFSGTAADLTTNIGRYVTPDSNNWFTGGVQEVFDDHLMENNAGYPTSGEFRWKGPYLGTVGVDPWGRPYCCNIEAVQGAVATTGNKCVVISAGPDGIFQTDSVLATTDDVQGDDIVALVNQR